MKPVGGAVVAVYQFFVVCFCLMMEVVGLAHVSGCFCYWVLINLKLAVCSLSAKLSRALRVVFRANTQMIEPPGGGMVRRFGSSVGHRARLANANASS